MGGGHEMELGQTKRNDQQGKAFFIFLVQERNQTVTKYSSFVGHSYVLCHKRKKLECEQKKITLFWTPTDMQ
jgi:hypothetical protein